MEEFRFKENLSVRDGNNVCRDVCGHVTRLCLDDGQSRDRTAAVLGRNAGCTFKQARMQIEYIARICFTSRRAANQQRKCAVSNGVFAQIIVNNENILALFAEILGHCAAGIGNNVLHGCAFGSGSANDDSVVHCACFLQRFGYLCNEGVFLSDRNIDAYDVLAALVNNCVNRNGSFARLPVADDKLTLASADRNHAVDSFDAGLQRNRNTFAADDARSFSFDRASFGAVDGSLAVYRAAESMDNSAQKRFTDGNGNYPSRAADFGALVNVGFIGKHGD